MDWKVWELCPDRLDQQRRGLRLQEPGHVLDGEEVDLKRYKLRDLHTEFSHGGVHWMVSNAQARHQVTPISHTHLLEVVVDVVLALWVENITRVADGRFNHTTREVNGIDADLEVRDVVERVEDSEDIHPALLRLGDKLIDNVVWI